MKEFRIINGKKIHPYVGGVRRASKKKAKVAETNFTPPYLLSLIKDIKDERDFTMESSPDLFKSAAKLPLLIDYTGGMSPIKDQGRLGCHDFQTEILTENGWKLFKDLDKEEKIASVNPDNHKIEYQKPTNYMEYDYEGDMYYFNHKSGLDALVTPNHNMYLKKWDSKNGILKKEFELVKAEDAGWYSGLLTSLNWDKKSPDFIQMPDVEIGIRNGSTKQSIRVGEKIATSDFVTFLGLYLAEGCCYYPEDSGSYRIEIAASDNNLRKEEVISIIDKLPYNYTLYFDRITIHNKSLYTYLKPFGNVYNKRVPRFIMDLSKTDIECFLHGYYLGDGSFHEKGARTGYSVSESLIDDIQELTLKIGNFGRKKIRAPRTTYIRGREVNGKESYEFYERTKNTKLSIDKKRALEIIPYNNKVYCVEVPNHIIITRRKGCILIAGNSCVGFATAAMKEWQEKNEHDTEIKEGKKDHRKGKDYDYSEAWIYWNCKKIDGYKGEGTYIRTAMNVLNKIGVPTEKAWPYSDDKLNIGEPKRWASMIAKWALAGTYYRVDTVEQAKVALDKDGPFVMGVPCYYDFFFPVNGVIKDPVDGERSYGGHAICLSGDTEIPLLNGEVKTLKELSEEYSDKTFEVYSCSKEGKIVKGVAHSPRKTDVNRNLLKITLDNGKFIKCTEDHLIMKRDGSYSKAENLKINDSLMPLYRENDYYGYEKIWDNSLKKWVRTHRMSCHCKDNMVVHHKNFNKKDNSSKNLQSMTWGDHTILHSQNTVVLKKYAQSKEGRGKSREVMTRNWKNNEFREKMKKINSQNGEKVSKKLLEEGRLGFQNMPKEKIREMGLKNGLKNHLNLHKKETFEEYLEVKLHNHKIISIEKCKNEDVYDITVDKYHNFAIDSGIFVHNCAVGYDDSKRLIKFKNSWSADWGQDGYGYISYNYFNKYSWSSWACTDVEVTREMLKGSSTL